MCVLMYQLFHFLCNSPKKTYFLQTSSLLIWFIASSWIYIQYLSLVIYFRISQHFFFFFVTCLLTDFFKECFQHILNIGMGIHEYMNSSRVMMYIMEEKASNNAVLENTVLRWTLIRLLQMSFFSVCLVCTSLIFLLFPSLLFLPSTESFSPMMFC